MCTDLAKIRSLLEEMDYPFTVQMPDYEIEKCLFKPGSQRLTVLRWVLYQFDGDLVHRFRQIKETEMEKEIEKYFIRGGLCRPSQSDVLLGHASRTKQVQFWEYILQECHLVQKSNTIENKHLHHTVTRDISVLLKVISSKEIKDMLKKEPKLLPDDINIPQLQETLNDLQILLNEAEQLLNFTEMLEGSSCDNLESHDSVSLVCSHSDFTGSAQSRLKSETQSENVKEAFTVGRNKINNLFKKVKNDLAVAVEKVQVNPVCERLSKVVEDLSPQITSLNQFIENTKDIKSTTAVLSKSTELEPVITGKKKYLREFVISMNKLLASIHYTIRTNRDILELSDSTSL